MNRSPGRVDFLGSAGIEAAYWGSIGERDALDTDIMAYAAARDYVVLTHDLDFGAILAATNGFHLIDAFRRMEVDLEQGALLTIEPGRARMRLLPLPD